MIKIVQNVAKKRMLCFISPCSQYSGKICCWLLMSLMFKCSWEMFFSFLIEDREVFKADRNKLFASNEKQTDNHTSMLDMLLSNMSVVCIEVVSFLCCGS